MRTMTTMASILLFIRHAETALKGTFCGQSDPALNADGLAQLPALVARLTCFKLDLVLTSDLARAEQTATAIAEPHQLAIQARSALREIDFGAWEGLTWEEIERRDPAYASRWVAEFPALPAPGGEGIPQFKHRVLEEIAWLRQLPQTTIAVVTHAGVLRVLLEELGHFSPHHAWERTRDYTCTIRCTQQTQDGYLEIHP